MDEEEIKQARQLCMDRGVPEDAVNALPWLAAINIAEFINKHNNAVFERVSRKCVIFQLKHKEYLFNKKTGKIQGAPSSAGESPDEAGRDIANEVMTKYPSAKTRFFYEKNGYLNVIFDSDVLDISTVRIDMSLLYKKQKISRLINDIKISPKPGVKKKIIDSLNKGADESKKKLGISESDLKHLSNAGMFLTAHEMTLANIMFRNGIDGKNLALVRNGMFVYYSLVNTGCKISIDEGTENICSEAEKVMKKVLPFLKNEKKYKEAIKYVKGLDATDDIKLLQSGCLSVSFSKLGRAQVNPLKPYKRILKAWLKDKKNKEEEKKKAKEKEIINSPLYNQIVPMEMLKLIANSEHYLTGTSIAKIMKGNAVSDFYKDAEDWFKVNHNNDVFFSFIPDDVLNSCLENLLSEGCLQEIKMKGTYGSFYVYKLIKKGEKYVELMKNHDSKKGEYAELKKLIRKTDTKDTAKCIQALSVMLEKPQLACAEPEFFVKCAMNDVSRTKALLVMSLSLADDGNQKKTIRKMKKIIMQKEKEACDL